jgi:DegV family protein with EDD domain
MPIDLVQKWNFGIAPLFVQLGNENYRDGIDLSVDDFYRWCRTHTELPKTAQPSVGVCQKLIEESLEEYDHVLCMTISTALSGTYQAFKIASEGYEDRVTIYDSFSGSLGLSLLMLHAAELLEKGLSLAEVMPELQSYRQQLKVNVALETLEYAVKGGRVSRLSYFAANMLSIKPVVFVDYDGTVKVLEKVRSESRALRYLLSTIKEKYGNTRPPRIGVAHGDNLERMQAFLQMLEEEIQPEDIIISQIGPVIGTYAAPGALLVTF